MHKTKKLALCYQYYNSSGEILEKLLSNSPPSLIELKWSINLKTLQSFLLWLGHSSLGRSSTYFHKIIRRSWLKRSWIRPYGNTSNLAEESARATNVKIKSVSFADNADNEFSKHSVLQKSQLNVSGWLLHYLIEGNCNINWILIRKRPLIYLLYWRCCNPNCWCNVSLYWTVSI